MRWIGRFEREDGYVLLVYLKNSLGIGAESKKNFCRWLSTRRGIRVMAVKNGDAKNGVPVGNVAEL
jgi:hypothetical protein